MPSSGTQNSRTANRRTLPFTPADLPALDAWYQKMRPQGVRVVIDGYIGSERVCESLWVNPLLSGLYGPSETKCALTREAAGILLDAFANPAVKVGTYATINDALAEIGDRIDSDESAFIEALPETLLPSIGGSAGQPVGQPRGHLIACHRASSGTSSGAMMGPFWRRFHSPAGSPFGEPMATRRARSGGRLGGPQAGAVPGR